MEELDVRGTPVESIEEYLVALGGVRVAAGQYAGPGWQAELEVLEHKAFGTIVPRVIVRFSGAPDTVAEMARKLRLRAIRVGG